MKTAFSFLLVVFLFLSCKSTKDLSIVEAPKTRFVMPELKSTLNVHYKIDKQAIRDTFNTLIDTYLASDMELSYKGVHVTIDKIEDATVEFAGRTVLTTLPLSIGLDKATIFSNINAQGSLELSFVTELDMTAQWTLVTNTLLEHYEWIDKPKLSLGAFNIPVGSLANSIIDKSKSQFELQIDKSVNEQLDIKDKVLDLMKYVEKPIALDTVLNSWAQVVPEKIYLSEINNNEQWTTGNVTVQGRTKVTSYEPTDKVTGLSLPVFSWEKDLDDTSHINMVIDFGFDKMNQYVEENFVNKTFSNDGKTITVKDVKIFSEGENLVSLVDVKGSFTGVLRLTGKPIFDNSKQAFYVDDLDVKVQTKNILHRAGAWLLKSKIKNQLKKLMYFSIEDNIESIQKQIDTQLSKYAVKDKLRLNADLRRLVIDKFVIDTDRIHAFTTVNIYLETVIYDMSLFDAPAINSVPMRK